MQKTILIVIAAVAVVVIGWAMWPSGDGPAPESTAPVDVPPAPELTPPEPLDATPVATPPATAAQEPEPEVVLPALPESDEFVRERIEPFDLPEPWLDQGDYVRRLAVLAENASRGTYPRRQLAFLAPSSPFMVVERGEEVFVDPASYDRYDAYVAELEDVDPARLAGLLETLNPLVETALEEVGVDAPPGEVFAAAVKEVLAVPVLSGEVELIQPNVMYQYADPELESLSPLKKQVLRMGPQNVQRLQTYLRKVADEMGLAI